MADNNGSVYKEKLSITLPVQMIEVLDDFCKYHGMKRSSAIAFLLAQSLAVESAKTNGFDFESVYDVVEVDGKEYVLKRKDVTFKDGHDIGRWIYALGRNNQGKVIAVSSDDFENED